MKWVIRAYSFVLLGYTGWRTYDLLLHNLPADWSSSLLAMLFLFAAEIGLVLWHEASINSTTTYTQHYVATALTWLDFVGSTVAGVGDMIIRQTIIGDYAVPPLLAMVIIYGLPAIMAANVAGALVYLSNDGQAVKDREKRMLSFEAHEQAIRELKQHRGRLVVQAKRDIYAEITGAELGQEPQHPTPKTPAIVSGNGRGGEVVYPVETDRPNLDLGKVRGKK